MKQRSVTEADAYIGKRLRAARNEVSMVQADAGEAVGVSFQQIQKYEKGTNRVGAARLQQFTVLYGKPLEWFMPPNEKVGKAMSRDLGAEMLTDSFGRKMVEAWLVIDNEARASVLQMAEAFVGRGERRAARKAAA